MSQSTDQSRGTIDVELLLFARAAELAGARRLTISVPGDATISEVGQIVAQRHPQLKDLVEISRWASADAFLSDDVPVADLESLAMIPPVSGG